MVVVVVVQSLTLDQNEFGFALKEMGFDLKDNEVQTLMERFDREGDGEIDYREFAGWVTGTVLSSSSSLLLLVVVV